ncbi:flagellar type III secretion system pore protein FliP [Hyphomicrobium sp.]|uniref:flagellar type III secretion system pore protein FliP n=1 Tax=Hyphomicrobium sp. TaxID=82 RepID=UPI002E34C0B7|nr:flagellar type III secretion system pore protein FliP [Hyphomicrobium sp.]HEX2841783.1 flagellar type III secretion system pore protein FliP [Hyphomicrobium sp.]
MKRLAVLTLLMLLIVPGAALAQAQGLNFEGLLPSGEQTVTGRMVQLVVLITMLSVAPGLLMMVTCFTRFVIVLSLLRAGLGLQTTPANMILVSLALFMTFYVMAPTFDRAWQNGLKPFVENKITEQEAYVQITQPLREFMRANVRAKDLELFQDLAQERFGANPDDSEVELRVLIPAFMISELRRGFEMGFLVVLPFLVIDLIVATLTMSMGMMMLPPTVMSLPFKVLFFVLIDGWNLLIGGLVRSFP